MEVVGKDEGSGETPEAGKKGVEEGSVVVVRVRVNGGEGKLVGGKWEESGGL